MAHSSEVIYGVQLLDDLHNYFPDILYNNSRFRNVQDILSYITLTTRTRFNLYNVGRNRYYPPTSRRNTVHMQNDNTDNKVDDDNEESSDSDDNINMNTTSNNAHARGSSPDPVRVSATVRTIPTTDMYTTLEPMVFQVPLDLGRGATRRAGVTGAHMDEVTSSLNLINSLTSLFTVGGGGLSSSFLNPVEVRPTNEQIQNATRIFNMTIRNEDDVCAICQDDMNIGNSIREIQACHHKFHRTCIDTWFSRNVHCPVCRHDIRETVAESSTTH
jgi:hypothetical protein